MTSETYFVLYDPERQRYYSNRGVGRIFVRAATAFLSRDAAANCRGWSKNKRFSEIHKVELASGKDE